MKPPLLLISALIILVGCSQTTVPSSARGDAGVSSLRTAQEDAIKAFTSKNGDRMVAAYSPDAKLMLSNSPILQGEELKTAIRSLAADPNFSIEFTTDKLEMAKSGELGYTRGAYTMTVSDPITKKRLREKGKYVTIYGRQPDGSWKMIEDINNSDGPAVAVPAK